MKSTQIYKIAQTVLFDALCLFLLYTGVIQGLTGPTNLFIFISWITLILVLSLLFTHEAGIKGLIPIYFKRVYFGSIVGILAWHGWFVIGCAWLFSASIYEVLIKKYAGHDKESLNQKSPNPGSFTAHQAGQITKSVSDQMP